MNTRLTVRCAATWLCSYGNRWSALSNVRWHFHPDGAVLRIHDERRRGLPHSRRVLASVGCHGTSRPLHSSCLVSSLQTIISQMHGHVSRVILPVSAHFVYIGRVSYIRISLCYFCFRWKTVSLVQAVCNISCIMLRLVFNNLKLPYKTIA